jgi:hypothetical protein
MKTRHHRKPRSVGGSDRKDNISRIPEDLHRAWHLLFANNPPHTIANLINEFYIDPDWELTVMRRNR